MKLGKNVINVTSDIITDYDANLFATEEDYENHARDIIQAYLSERWKLFNAEDESTFPKTEYAPSGKQWLVKLHEIKPSLYGSRWDKARNRWAVFNNNRVVYYLDPADILPKEDK